MCKNSYKTQGICHWKLLELGCPIQISWLLKMTMTNGNLKQPKGNLETQFQNLNMKLSGAPIQKPAQKFKFKWSWNPPKSRCQVSSYFFKFKPDFPPLPNNPNNQNSPKKSTLPAGKSGAARWSSLLSENWSYMATKICWILAAFISGRSGCRSSRRGIGWCLRDLEKLPSGVLHWKMSTSWLLETLWLEDGKQSKILIT